MTSNLSSFLQQQNNRLIMKIFKSRISLLMFLFASFCFITACSSDDDNNDQDNNKLKNEFFSIENAKFVNKNIPVGDEQGIISSFFINKTILNGGSSIASFSSTTPLSKFFIGVEGVEGYYEVPLSATTTRSNIFDYQVVLLISQNIATGDNIRFRYSFETNEGNTTTATNTDAINVIEAGTGALQISLSWDQLDDVDLHVFDPDNKHIFYNNRAVYTSDYDETTSYNNFVIYVIEKYTDYDISNLDPNKYEDAVILKQYYDEVEDSHDLGSDYTTFLGMIDKSGVVGYLDIDSNAGCSIDAINNENIFFGNPKNGVYKIYVDLYEKCGSSSVQGSKYSVTVNYEGTSQTISDKQVGQFEASDRGSGNIPSRYVAIGEFTVSGRPENNTKSQKETQKSLFEDLIKKSFSKK